jgi:hypothetical protein
MAISAFLKMEKLPLMQQVSAVFHSCPAVSIKINL